MRFKVRDFCDFAKFAKLSHRRMFSPKLYKADFE